MSTNIIMHKPEGLSSEIINDSFVRLLKYRVPTVAGGQVKFYCLAKDGTGLLDNIIHLPIRENADTNYGDESYDILQLLLEPILTNDDFTKNVIWNPRLIPLDLCQTAILSNIPNKGNIAELPIGHGMDAETLNTIQENKMPFIELPLKWWDDPEGLTEYKGEWYLGFNGSDLKDIAVNMTIDTVAEYKDKGGVWKYIEDSFKGVVLPTKLAQFSPYHLNDQEKNDSLNAQYEEKIRPYYPTEWYPPQEDEMDAPLFSYNHEWRDIAKQVRFLYLEGEDDPKTDMYARLWIL